MAAADDYASLYASDQVCHPQGSLSIFAHCYWLTACSKYEESEGVCRILRRTSSLSTDIQVLEASAALLSLFTYSLPHYLLFRYDNGTQTYDSSEKQRIPAWTDRILYSGKNVRVAKRALLPVLTISSLA